MRGYASDAKLLSVKEIRQQTWVAVHVPRREAESRSAIGDRRRYWVQLVFGQPIVGPIRLGHSSSFGLGLFVPDLLHAPR